MTNDKRKEEAWEKKLPPEVVRFLREVVQGSLMRYDVLYFFYKNPYAIVTISDLSVWISREEKPLAEALQQLYVMGYLSQSYASSAFALTRDHDKRHRLEEVFDYLAEDPALERAIRSRLRREMEVE